MSNTRGPLPHVGPVYRVLFHKGVRKVLLTYRHHFPDLFGTYLTVYWLSEPAIKTGNAFHLRAVEYATLCLKHPTATAALLKAVMDARKEKPTTKKAVVFHAADSARTNRDVDRIAAQAGVSLAMAQTYLGQIRTEQQEFLAKLGWYSVEESDGTVTLGIPNRKRD